MKKILLMMVCSIHLSVCGQVFQLQGANLGETDPDMRAISIGSVANTTDIQARLHVNNFFCNSPTSTTFNGKLFRTDGDYKVINSWTMWNGADATTQTEQFRLYIDDNTTPFVGLRSLNNGFRFETGGSDVRMRINGVQTNGINSYTIPTNGFVGLCSNQAFWTTVGAL